MSNHDRDESLLDQAIEAAIVIYSLVVFLAMLTGWPA